jgi:quercetin dioxygenase-like cupin family protein
MKHQRRRGKMEILKINSLAEFSSEKYMKVAIRNTNGFVRLLCFEPSQSVALHKHPDGDEVFYVLSGRAEFTVGKETARVEAGSFVKAEAGMLHGWKNGAERLILISVLIPPSSYKLAEQAAKMEFV